MSRLKKILLVVGISIVVIVAVVAVYGYSFARGSLSVYSGEFSTNGLSSSVTVYRDDRGVPHIYADTMEDLAFAQGFVHAQERLWQMETHRRFAHGRLSELIGESLLETDIQLRTAGLNRITRRVAEITSSEGRLVLEAYAAGVNAYLDQGRLPPEYGLLGLTPEPWTLEDSAGVVALLAYNLGGNWRVEATRLALQEALEQELFEELLPPFEGWETPSVWTREKAGEAQPADTSYKVGNLLELLAASDMEQFASLPRLGSNSWAVSPALAETGTAILANDPHLNISLPGIWFENHLAVEGEMEVYGWVVPGVPGVVIGHNEHISWGMTNIGDSQDLYLEKQDPDNPFRFFRDGEWYEAEVIREEITVKGREEPEVLEVIITENGPLISQDPPLSMRWTAYDIEASTIDALFGVNRAQDWEQFIEALDHFTVPIQTIVYADTAGNIGFRVVGLVPQRKQGQGILPLPGWDSDNSWEGFIPMRELPELFNPANGFIATANHMVESEGYPYTIALDVAPHYRKQRIIEVLGSGGKFSVEDFEALQNDWHNSHAAERLPRWLAVLANQELSDLERSGLELLQAWVKEPVNLPEAAAPSIFQTWYLNFMEEVFVEKMGGDLYRAFIDNAYLAYNALEYLLEKGDSAWFGDDLNAMLLASYRKTMVQLDQQWSGKPEQWQWQKLQTITFEHLMGEVAILRPLVNRGPFPYGGDHMTVGRAAYALTDPFKVNSAAGLRFIAVMDPGGIRSRGVLAGGQSGHPLSKHYDDQIEAWLTGHYYDLIFSREALLQQDLQIMELNKP